MVVGLGKANDEIHGDLLERKGGWVSGDFVHRGASAVSDDLVLLTRCTSLNIVRNPRSHVWPPIIPLGLSYGLVASWVSGYESFVHYSHDFSLKRQVWGNR